MREGERGKSPFRFGMYSNGQKRWSKVALLKPRLTQPLTTFFGLAEYYNAVGRVNQNHG